MFKRLNFQFFVIHFLLFFSFLCISSYAQNITPEDASNYVGETKTICGKVASSKYAVKSRGSPTFLNLNKPYPNHIFTVVIWGSDRHKFKNSPELFYKGENICVTGLINIYRGKPQIIVDKPSQIEIQMN
ncbi:DNA-binding protein [Desulfobacterota bacterium AH_259_B03_O07]|nr:DNA-binding protein [Desulfobacterota bacterium AH_259_B03_O07]